MHRNASSSVKLLQCWVDHVNLLVNLYLFDGFVIIVSLLRAQQSILNLALVLKRSPELDHLLITGVDKRLLNRDKVLEKLLLSVALYVLNLENFNGEELVHLLSALDEEVEDNFQNVGLEETDHHKHAIFSQYSNHLREISMTHQNSFIFVVNCDGVESSLVDCEVVLVGLDVFQVGDVSYNVVESILRYLRQILRNPFLHFRHHRFFIIHTDHIQI